MSLRSGLIVARASVLACALNGLAVCAAPVEGDAEALKLLRAAQATNRTLFARGEMTVEVTSSGGRRSARAHMIWDGDKTFWDYEVTETAQEEESGSTVSVTRARMIEVPGMLMWYSPKARLAQKRVARRRGEGYQKLLELRPDQGWFRMECMIGPKDKWDWQTLLDPSAAHPDVTKFVVRRDGDRVTVDRHEASGNILRIEASLAQGGNVVSYETLGDGQAGRSGTAWQSGRCVWAADPQGNWHLKSYTVQRSNSGDPEELHIDLTVSVKSFNPNPVIARDRFQFASLDFEPGTIVEELGGRQRTYRIGQESGVGQGALDALAEEMKRRGFAAPQRRAK